jgi:hypothetical protein
MRRAGHVAWMGERTAAYRVLVGKPEGKRPPGRPRHRWKDKSKMYLQVELGRTRTGLTWLGTGTGDMLM